MCHFFSCIVTKSGDVLQLDNSDSHEDIIEKYKDSYDLYDTFSEPHLLKFARVEITPPNNDVFAPLTEWNFNIDQSITPTWFTDVDKENCFKVLKAFLEKSLIIGKEIDTLDCGRYWIKDSKIGYVKGSAIVKRLSGKSSIRALRDSAMVEYMGDTSTIQYMCDFSKVRTASDSTTIENMSEHSLIESLCQGARVFNMEAFSRITSMWNNSSVETMYNHASICSMHYDAKVSAMRGNSNINHMHHDSIVENMYDRSTISHMYDDSKVKAIQDQAYAISTFEHKNKFDVMCGKFHEVTVNKGK